MEVSDYNDVSWLGRLRRQHTQPLANNNSGIGAQKQYETAYRGPP